MGLRNLPDESVDCCVTSPPYFGLRDYGHEGQIGLEETPDAFVEKMVEVFTEVKRVLKKEGTLWLNLGDSYGSKGGDIFTGFNERWNGTGVGGGKQAKTGQSAVSAGNSERKTGLAPKNLLGMPWRVAFALQASGWILRQDIIWHKPNPMPESVTDRCTKAHEYIFLLSKSQKYFYDHEAIKEEAKDISIARMGRGVSESNKLINGSPGQTPHSVHQPRPNRKQYDKSQGGGGTSFINHSGNYKADGTLIGDGKANKRSVWSVTTKPFSDAHFATFPEDLIVDCIKAGCPDNGVVLDPFMGAGTTALVASKLNRNFIGFELNPQYIEIATKRLQKELGMFNKHIA